jgi:hypothetical protein
LIRNANPVEAQLIAKWLVYPRTSKRQKRSLKDKSLVKGGRKLQEETQRIMHMRIRLYDKLSREMGWLVQEHRHNLEFVGLKEWKKQYNGTLESVLFSTGKIVELGKEDFFRWLDILPAGARYRVRRRLLDSDDNLKPKWNSTDGVWHPEALGNWFLEWENFKKGKQAEARNLKEKVRQGTATTEDKQQLEKVKKEAKVTTGGTNLYDVLTRMIKGVSSVQEAELLSEALIEKVDFQVPVLLIADDSGSMRFRDNGVPMFMAQILATLILLKNPSDEVDDVMVRFGSNAEFLTSNMNMRMSENRFMQSHMKEVKGLVDRTKSFIENYKQVQKLLTGNQGGTRFDKVSYAFKEWVESTPDAIERNNRIELIQKFPVMLVVADGDFNGAGNAYQVMAQFQQNMLQWFGWNGVVVLWDVRRQKSSSFEGLHNVIHVKDGFNASTVNQIFTKIHDLDVIDVFTPLKSLYMSNRYDALKKEVL